ncbi:MAG: hypothetical protein IH985_08975 [Planctomycetes bacterium]|nr:hypothetical protein [Planctomycetota bacterium]
MTARPTRMTLSVPGDYLLARDYCSYGYFLLAPNHWDPDTHTLYRVLDLEDSPAVLAVNQGPPFRTLPRSLRGKPLTVRASRVLSRAEQSRVRADLSRMLRLDEDRRTIAAFHRADPRWKRSGRGRLMRSPTLFEDILKTVTSCNVTWPGTVNMNRRLCEVLGTKVGQVSDLTSKVSRVSDLTSASCPLRHTFPTPEKLARARATTLRGRCRVGYRDRRMIELARLFASRRGKPPTLDPRWFEDPRTPSGEIHDTLLSLPGIGPYAAANIMQLLGRYDRLPLDTESVRHGRDVLGLVGTDAHVMKKVADHFAPFGRHAFRSYWFEMWTHYEKKVGPSWTWRRETDATQFTASKL